MNLKILTKSWVFIFINLSRLSKREFKNLEFWIVHHCRYENLPISSFWHKHDMPKVWNYNTVYFLSYKDRDIWNVCLQKYRNNRINEKVAKFLRKEQTSQVNNSKTLWIKNVGYCFYKKPNIFIDVHLAHSWRKSLSYRNQCTDMQSKSMDWFLCDRDLPHERDTDKILLGMEKAISSTFSVIKFFGKNRTYCKLIN